MPQGLPQTRLLLRGALGERQRAGHVRVQENRAGEVSDDCVHVLVERLAVEGRDVQQEPVRGAPAGDDLCEGGGEDRRRGEPVAMRAAGQHALLLRREPPVPSGDRRALTPWGLLNDGEGGGSREVFRLRPPPCGRGLARVLPHAVPLREVSTIGVVQVGELGRLAAVRAGQIGQKRSQAHGVGGHHVQADVHATRVAVEQAQLNVEYMARGHIHGLMGEPPADLHESFLRLGLPEPPEIVHAEPVPCRLRIDALLSALRDAYSQHVVPAEQRAHRPLQSVRDDGRN